MAGRPIEIIVDADTSGVERGATTIANSLERVGDTLSDVQDQAQDTGRELTDALSDGAREGARDAERGLERVEDSLGDVGDRGREIDRDLTRSLSNVGDEARRMGQDVERSTGESFSRASETTETFSNEARANLSESVSSFRGDIEDMPQLLQDVLGGVSADLGALGGLAAAGIAAAIGVAIAKLQQLAEKNTEAKEAVGELGVAFYDAGGQLDNAEIADRMKEIAFALAQEDVWYKWGDNSKTNIEMVTDALGNLDNAADQNGVRQLWSAMAGDVDSAAKAYEFLDKAQKETQKQLGAEMTVLSDGSTQLSERGEALNKVAQSQDELREKLEEQVGTAEEAKAQAEIYTKVMGESTESVEGRTAAEQELVDAQNERLEAERELAASNMTLAEQQIAMVEGTNELTESLNKNGTTMDINTEQGRNNQKALLDQVGTINSLAQAQVDAGMSVEDATGQMQAQKDALVNQVAPAFGGSTEEARKYIERMLQVPKAVDTKVGLNGIPGAQDELNKFTSQKPTVGVEAKVTTDRATAYNQIYGAFSNHAIPVNMIPRGGMQAMP